VPNCCKISLPTARHTDCSFKHSLAAPDALYWRKNMLSTTALRNGNNSGCSTSVNVDDWERMLSIVGGGALVLHALRQRTLTAFGLGMM
jgi:hypothetical protein